MDAEWCIVCDTKILASNESFAASAYCSSDCLIAAQIDARSRPSSPINFPPASAYPRRMYGSLPQPKKFSSGFTFSGCGLGELSLDSSSESATTTSTSTSNLSRPAPPKQNQHQKLSPCVRIDSLYPTQSGTVNLEQHWTKQFLRGSEYSPESTLSCGPTTLANSNVPVKASKQTAYIFPDDDASEADIDEAKDSNIGRSRTACKSRRTDGERGRSEKMRPIAIVYA